MLADYHIAGKVLKNGKQFEGSIKIQSETPMLFERDRDEINMHVAHFVGEPVSVSLFVLVH